MNPSLALAIINGSTIKTYTFLCLIDAMSLFKRDYHVIAPIGGYPHHSRNLVVETARKNKATHLMFIDNDMVFPPDGINRLFEQDKMIIAANYHERGLPLNSTIKLADEKGNLISGSEDDFPKETFKCFAVPTGFTLINMEVFDKIEKPYFFIEDDGEFCTEDFYFCKKAGKGGIEVWCDPTISVKHIGDYLY